jgi:hypothetical protein
MIDRFLENVNLSTVSPLILCSSCHEPLWSVSSVIPGQLAMTPVGIEVPPFSGEISTCPHCDQSILLEGASDETLLIRDQISGRLSFITLSRRLVA